MASERGRTKHEENWSGQAVLLMPGQGSRGRSGGEGRKGHAEVNGIGIGV